MIVMASPLLDTILSADSTSSLASDALGKARNETPQTPFALGKIVPYGGMDYQGSNSDQSQKWELTSNNIPENSSSRGPIRKRKDQISMDRNLPMQVAAVVKSTTDVDQPDTSVEDSVGYKDYSHVPVDGMQDPSAAIYAAASGKGPPFPVKLHRILSDPEFRDIITWLPHGRAWRVLKPKLFEQRVIPLHFRHCRYSSFMRQVNGWGFKRVSSGPDLNAYYHECFLRGLPHVCLKMRRPTGKQVPKSFAEASKDPDPDFYAISQKHPLPQPSSELSSSLVAPKVLTPSVEPSSLVGTSLDLGRRLAFGQGQQLLAQQQQLAALEEQQKRLMLQQQELALARLRQSMPAASAPAGSLFATAFTPPTLQQQDLLQLTNQSIIPENQDSKLQLSSECAPNSKENVDELRKALAASQLQNKVLMESLKNAEAPVSQLNQTNLSQLQVSNGDRTSTAGLTALQLAQLQQGAPGSSLGITRFF